MKVVHVFEDEEYFFVKINEIDYCWRCGHDGPCFPFPHNRQEPVPCMKMRGSECKRVATQFLFVDGKGMACCEKHVPAIRFIEGKKSPRKNLEKAKRELACEMKQQHVKRRLFGDE
jgi:hypothetical protein